MSDVIFQTIDAVPEARVAGSWRGVTEALIERRLSVSTMESCTAGLLASLITDTEGASAIMRGAFVTYCNAAKVMQGVPQAVIDRYGVYSPETASAMARACRSAYAADIGIGVTGTLGRLDPENPDSVSGEVYFAIDACGDVRARALRLFPGLSRHEGKLAVAQAVAERLLDRLAELPD